MSRQFRFRSALVVGATLGAFSGSAAAATVVVTYTDLAAYTAATASTTTVGFGGILPVGTFFKDFNPLVTGGVTFATSTPKAEVNVTSPTYYSPADYPAPFITGGYTGNPPPSFTLNVTLAAPVYALALDYGLTGTGAGVITFSNGFVNTSSATLQVI